MTDAYLVEGERRACELGNRGPLRFDGNGNLRQEIVDAYWRTGFYVFEGVVGDEELSELKADFARVLERAPHARGADTDAQGRPALGVDLERPQFQFAKPLSDPAGGTAANDGRHPVKMSEPEAAAQAPEEVLSFIGGGALQLMDAYLRLYGHPDLLAVAERINGPDFVPWNEGIFVKQPGLGPSTAWHQDGTTHWDSGKLDAGTHGFNTMAQLYPTTPANALWVVPGTHRSRFDIAAHVAANGGSDRLPGAVPMLCNPGDVAINNRQVVHGAFANQSAELRVTLVFGFHRRSALLGVTRGDPPVTYDAARIHERSRIIALAIDARHQRFPHERSYRYQPLAGELDANRWNEAARASILRNYDTKTMFI
ncbi:MAG: phytanoyl-CoA dioxygenase family protein [Spirochaetaceae bacterium]|nr:phytanoyl-CoA dioxygenase family protein [Spirochaetaceae bacterium]